MVIPLSQHFSQPCLRGSYKREGNLPSWIWIFFFISWGKINYTEGLRSSDVLQVKCSSLHWMQLLQCDTFDLVWLLVVSVFANYLVGKCINVIHWQHERQRNYSWRCRPVCYNSGICQLSVLFISHLSLKLFVGLSANGGFVASGFLGRHLNAACWRLTLWATTQNKHERQILVIPL